MEKELVKFALENNLSPFNKNKQSLDKKNNIFKTKDAKAVFNKVIGKISENFVFADTRSFLDYFEFTDKKQEILLRQEFFRKIPKNIDNNELKYIKNTQKTWKPKYGIVAVTENEKTLLELQKLNCPVKFISSSEDCEELEDYDLVQAIDCEESKIALERLNQTVFINEVEDAYLERFLELLSGWKENFKILRKINDVKLNELLTPMEEILKLTNDEGKKKISASEAENSLEEINNSIEAGMKEINFSGNMMFQMLSSGKIPGDVQKLIEEAIEKTGLPENIFTKKIPVELDSNELSKLMKEQEADEYVNIAESIKRKSQELKLVPSKLREIEIFILLADFYAGLSKFIQEENLFHEDSNEFRIYSSKNLFLDKAQPVSFYLDEQNRCSILTGANSGGKTTLLEHIIQLISLQQLGLPVSGNVKMPLFTDIYYFAKNKGSASKGAFETLLNQMSTIKPGANTLILADEIESVTEPGVAGKIIASTAEYFIKKQCFMVIATHLGAEINKNLPAKARIDGIEAKGLDENFELIVDHNPVIGKLASSTPELIIEKMARAGGANDYIKHLFQNLK